MITNYTKIKKIKNTKFNNKIPNNHKKILNSLDKSYFSNFVKENKIPTPPSNNSVKTVMELKKISKINFKQDIVKKYDDIYKVFVDFLESKGEEANKELIKGLLKESYRVVLFYKYKFNRPRPKQLAELYDIDLVKLSELDSMNTPSYPSGHSTQGVFIYKVLSDGYPDYKSDLKNIAKKISYSRQIARAHYPSDSKAGEKLGLQLYKEYIKNQNVD